MKRDRRLSLALHAVLHISASESPLTSEQLAKMLQTNPVVVRRLLAGLRESGFVRSDKGHGGGWTLARDLETMTFGDIHRALGTSDLFAFGYRSENPACPIEKLVNESLDEARDAAEAFLLKRFDQISLGSLSKDFRRRLAAHQHHKKGFSHEV